MARKLGLGWGAICCATLLLAGCQTTSSNRVASTTITKNPSVAKQSIPQPNFPTTTTPNNNGFNTATGGAFPTTPNQPANFQPSNTGFASQSQVNQAGSATNGAGTSPSGPQGVGTPTTANRNVTITQPNLPPQVPTPPSGFADPGIQQMPPLPR